MKCPKKENLEKKLKWFPTTGGDGMIEDVTAESGVSS
jgi:hypothetical protein